MALPKQLQKYYGLSVKEYANILRIHATYEDLSKGKTTPQKDFFDQSHFIKEIRKFTGVTPKQLAKNKNDRFLQLWRRKKQ